MSVWGPVQFSAGDQTLESRHFFWKNDFKKCPKCFNTNIVEVKHTEGCRMNGDAYGTDTFECKDCKWLTSFQWDDDSEPYYYETRGWKDLHPAEPAPPSPPNHSQDH